MAVYKNEKLFDQLSFNKNIRFPYKLIANINGNFIKGARYDRKKLLCFQSIKGDVVYVMYHHDIVHRKFITIFTSSIGINNVIENYKNGFDIPVKKIILSKAWACKNYMEIPENLLFAPETIIEIFGDKIFVRKEGSLETNDDARIKINGKEIKLLSSRDIVKEININDDMTKFIAYSYEYNYNNYKILYDIVTDDLLKTVTMVHNMYEDKIDLIRSICFDISTSILFIQTYDGRVYNTIEKKSIKIDITDDKKLTFLVHTDLEEFKDIEIYTPNCNIKFKMIEKKEIKPHLTIVK